MHPIITHAANPIGNRLAAQHRRPLARLPIVTKPITAETLASFLSRLANCNALRTSTWPLNQRKNPEFVGMLERLTGRDRRHLACALPELRTATTLAELPYLHQAVSSRAGTRPACGYCVAAIAGCDVGATVFATHDQLVCHRHQRWLGNGVLACTSAQQFSLRSCPTIAHASVRHRRLIRRWGRTAVHWRFDDALNAFHSWGRWSFIYDDPGIARRRKALNINTEQPRMSPRNVAAWYPNAVELTSILLSQTEAIKQAGRVTLDIVERGSDHIARHVVRDLRPEGAHDPYLRALGTTPVGPTREVGLPLPKTPPLPMTTETDDAISQSVPPKLSGTAKSRSKLLTHPRSDAMDCARKTER